MIVSSSSIASLVFDVLRILGKRERSRDRFAFWRFIPSLEIEIKIEIFVINARANNDIFTGKIIIIDKNGQEEEYAGEEFEE